MELWESVRARYGCEVKREYWTGNGSTYTFQGGARISLDSQTVYFEHNGQKYAEPGQCPRGENWKELKPVWDYDAPRTGVDGPDGKGEDCLIKSSQQLADSFTEIVSQLSSLEIFRWTSYVTPMPAGVCAALAKIQTLASLDITLSTERSNVWDGESSFSLSCRL